MATTQTVPKPDKPYEDFPLFAHATGRWAKKIRGKLYYFGPWADPQAALNLFLEQKDDLYAGRSPRVQRNATTIRDLLNHFLTAKQHQVNSKELAPRSFSDYRKTCNRIRDAFGLTRAVEDLRAQDFQTFRAALAKNWAPNTLAVEIHRVRVIFRFAYTNGLIDRPINYGTSFNPPTRKVIRQARQAKGARMFSAAELRAIIEAAPQPLKAMILLGINCGYGNADIAKLPVSALDLETGWVTFPRPKTAVERRCPLWPETIAAIRDALKVRPKPTNKADARLVFLTGQGITFWRDHQSNRVTPLLAKVLRRLEIQRPGLNFYTLRHVFETIGGESRDQIAVDHIMGHVRGDMATVYREWVSDERLKAVTDYVRRWLFNVNDSTAEAADENRR